MRLGRLEDAGAEHFVVAKGFELGLEDIDHGDRVAEFVEAVFQSGLTRRGEFVASDESRERGGPEG